MKGYHRSRFTDENVNAETGGILMLKVTQQVSYRSGLASENHGFNHHENHGYTDTETCLHKRRTSI